MVMKIQPSKLKLLIAAVGLLGLSLGAQPYQKGPVDADQAIAELVADVAEIRPGKTFDIALRLELDPHWHAYWKNPGDTGLAPSVDWEAPDGLTFSDLMFVAPERIITPPDFVSYGYEGEVFFISEVTVSEDFDLGQSITIKADASWLACEKMCIPGRAKLALELPVALESEGTLKPSGWAESLLAARDRIPAMPTSASLAFENLESTISASVRWEGLGGIDTQKLYFYAEEEGLINSAADQNFALSEDTLIVSMKKSEYYEGDVEGLTGVLQYEDGFPALDGKQYVFLNSDRSSLDVAEAVGSSLSPNSISLGQALLFAFLGGMILNLMPCVFPVLSIKALGFLQHSGADSREPFYHGLTFAAGVLVSFLVIAGVLIGLRAGGESLGWGFQLQSSYFVGGLLVVMFLFGLSLAGVFEFGTSAVGLAGRVKGENYGSSFFSGILATAVATPCTGPFMGSALGFALTLSAFQALTVFTLLAIGMAFPYVLLSSFPKLINQLPRPGPWMETFKQLMAFPMFATCIWLVWLMGAHVGDDGLIMTLGGLLVVALGAWIYGRWAVPSRAASVRRVAKGFAAISIVFGIWILLPNGQNNTALNADGVEGPDKYGVVWESFSPDSIEEARRDGRLVFVDFTAKWCLTCKANKAVVFSSDDVKRRFQELDAIMVRADWTKRNPLISEALESFGRSGVPLYVLYDGMNEPKILPELLNPGIVLDALDSVQNVSASVAQR